MIHNIKKHFRVDNIIYLIKPIKILNHNFNLKVINIKNI